MIKITLSVLGLCFLIERIFTGWRLPKVPTWTLRVIALNAVQLLIVLVAGHTWEKWLESKSLFHLSQSLNPVLAGFIAYFVATFVFYWWHRVRHESDFLWRHFHQIHHSPQRLEVITSFYKHPHEMIVNSLIGSALVYSFLGLSVEAGAFYTMFTALGEFFYHTNIKTPQWVGYIFQRPEMHRIHHQYNYHRNNYGDFAIWDMIFGTFENPKTWNEKCGFDEEKEVRLKDMLFLRDVHKMLFILFALIPTLGKPAMADTKYTSWNEACSAAEATVAEGDLVFLDTPHFLFRAVAKSTNSWTSHVGIVFKNETGWVVRESKVPLSGERPLCDYLKSSAEYKFEIRRFHRPLTPDEVATLRKISDGLFHKIYNFGFDFDSPRYFCSKFVYVVYKSIGIEVGTLQTFNELFQVNPQTETSFWKFWFFGSIPWERRTVTPASQLNDSQFVTILSGTQKVPGSLWECTALACIAAVRSKKEAGTF
jgi:sterol desaturase/sphingolipid hydroxylase (fatty acid hydroxylase superfamily)